MQTVKYSHNRNNFIPQFNVGNYFPCDSTTGIEYKYDGKENKILRHLVI